MRVHAALVFYDLFDFSIRETYFKFMEHTYGLRSKVSELHIFPNKVPEKNNASYKSCCRNVKEGFDSNILNLRQEILIQRIFPHLHQLRNNYNDSIVNKSQKINYRISVRKLVFTLDDCDVELIDLLFGVFYNIGNRVQVIIADETVGFARLEWTLLRVRHIKVHPFLNKWIAEF